MSENIVLTFALLFGAVVALICAVYTALTFGKRQRNQIPQTEEELEE